MRVHAHFNTLTYRTSVCFAVGVPQIELAVAPASGSRRRRMQEGNEASGCAPPFCISPDSIRNISKLAGASGKGGWRCLHASPAQVGWPSPGWELMLAVVSMSARTIR